MTLEMKTFLEIQDEELQLYLKHTNNRIARLDSEVEQKAEEAERLAGFYTENRLVLTEEQQRAIYLKIEEWFGDMAKIDDEKVRLANMMYDTTVAHIERMDKHVHDFQKLQEKHRRTELQAAEGHVNDLYRNSRLLNMLVFSSCFIVDKQRCSIKISGDD
ncbi:unnamed protein product [Heligmosomoides polygyrus]|uniref:ING domain-containing protein n=1 Tax=Heligmosomoides polygyrus TaxID=6339 RepID=A0A183G9W9_HELPZ|nr:unnamed protein product [Heligmosomoides polygyrus]